VTHVQHQNDADLHDENGEHITTCPSPAGFDADQPLSGQAIANWERRIQYHIQCHQVALEQGATERHLDES
jgi:hypothetical protein